MRLGISSYTYVWAVGVPGYEQPECPLTVWQLLNHAKDLGVHVVQIADNLSLGRLSTEERNRFAKSAESMGISIEIGTAGIDRSELLEGLSLATEFRSPILRLLVDSKGHEPTEEEVVLALTSVVPDFANAGVIMAIENHDRFSSATLRQIVEQIGSRYVGICFDTANSIGCLESAERVLDTLAPFVVNVHIKDYCVFRPAHLKGFVVEGRAAGYGHLKLAKLLSRIAELPHDCNVIVELWPPPQATLAESIVLESSWAQESVNYLRKFVTR